LHVHTHFSDGREPPETVIKHAAKLKAMGMLDGLAITDHDNTNGLEEARRIAAKLGIILIPGVEITTTSGDILALNVEEMPKARTAEEMIKLIHKLGGVACLAHPFGGYWQVPFPEMPEIVKKFDAIEVYNAFTPLDANLLAIKYAKDLEMVGVAGSDAHSLDLIGNAFIECDAQTPEEIVKAIRHGKVKVGWI
jgi:predicted metal-dependent phosphoesterase TrpH